MREILFRGKWKDNGEWFEGYYACIAENPVILTGKLDITKGTIGAETILVDPETVCQYTGLTDRNGRKIFEGDIVKYSVNTVGIINYATACFCVDDIKFRNNPAMDIVFEAFPNGIEVIGNIYDNPELLEVKQNEM